MYNEAPKVWEADRLANSEGFANIVFSVHMYEVYNERSVIDDYMKHFVEDLKLPLVVGEFGAEHGIYDVDEVSILELSDRYQIGYLGWSWSGNSWEVRSLDITIDFDVRNLSDWGKILIGTESSTYGIKKTAVPATIFTGSGPQPTSTPDSGTGGCNGGFYPGGCGG